MTTLDAAAVARTLETTGTRLDRSALPESEADRRLALPTPKKALSQTAAPEPDAEPAGWSAALAATSNWGTPMHKEEAMAHLAATQT